MNNIHVIIEKELEETVDIITLFKSHTCTLSANLNETSLTSTQKRCPI